ncbi:hypothetical protein SteCoe_25748 [Stentor coeruleus]|uniref:Uncharacterized protein n=1 Tax=Stentor coeruleus TaxID=5963 RepID=A0A1R2BET0_9CILI|nr:hypothetical protein SteCoe_25748 [Stentor coeruleus]
MEDTLEDKNKDMPECRVEDLLEDKIKAVVENLVEGPSEDEIKLISEIGMEDLLGKKMRDPHEDRVKDMPEERVKDITEDRMEILHEEINKDMLENRIGDSDNYKIENPVKDKNKDLIADRIKILHKNKIKKDPLEKIMQSIRKSEEFLNIIPEGFSNIHFEIELGLSDKDLIEKLKSPVRLFLSVSFIVDKRKEKFSYKNLYIYILCMKNLVEANLVTNEILVSEIEILLRKIYFFTFQPIVDETNFKAHTKEAKKCVKLFCLFLNSHNNLIVDFEKQSQFAYDLYRSNSFLKMIIEETSAFKKNLINLTYWKTKVDQYFKIIKTYDGYQGICLFDSACVLLGDYFSNIFKNMEIYHDIEKIMSSIWTPIIFDKAFALASKIDKEFLELLLQKIKQNENTKILKVIRKSITDSGKSLIDQYTDNYKRTPNKILPDIQELLCLGLYNFVKRSLDVGFNKAFTRYFQLNGEQGNFSLCSLIRRIDALPQQIQYFMAEILASIGKTEVNWFYFVIEKVQRNILFKEICKEWVADYVQLACAPPYCTFLNEFKEEKNDDLRTLLEGISPKIFLMDLPENVYGRTFYSSSIVLKLPLEDEGSKGATFVIYLHELAHYLQRSKSETIGASLSPRSEKNFDVLEGGYFIENKIFGTCLYYITVEAADYIVSMQVDKDHNRFMEVFRKKNEFGEGKKMISLHRSNNVILLGECGSRFRNSKRKPDKVLSIEKILK